MMVIKFIIFLFLVLNGSSVFGQTVKVGDIEASPGEMASGYLMVPEGKDQGTKIPITVINGEKSGPVLALIAGTHGYEYAPIIALQNIKKEIDPKDLSGTLILVHVANMPSFLGRTIYYSPIDGKNLNRAYPGLEDGSVSERIAFAMTQNIIRQADYVVDMHSGDGNEALRPYIYMPKGGDEKFNKTIKDMALAFGVDHIIIDQREIPEFEESIFTDATALALGKPSMTTETGQLGSTTSEWTDIAERGVWNLLRHFEMIEGENKDLSSVVWLENYEVIVSPETGMFRPSVKEGYAVAAGGKLGVLVDFFGEKITDIKAPFAGVVNYVIATPPISKGEPVAMISQVKN